MDEEERGLNEITPIVYEWSSTFSVSSRTVYQGRCLCGKSWLMMYSSVLAVELQAQLNVHCAQLCEEGELIMKTNMKPLSGSRCMCVWEKEPGVYTRWHNCIPFLSSCPGTSHNSSQFLK